MLTNDDVGSHENNGDNDDCDYDDDDQNYYQSNDDNDVNDYKDNYGSITNCFLL